MIEVSQSGINGYRHIQEAVDAAFANGETPALILIRDGVYDEPVQINKANLRIVGESQSRVVLRQPLQITADEVELENLQNGGVMIGQNNGRKVPSIFLCGSSDVAESGLHLPGYLLHDETQTACTLKGAVVRGILGRIELFLRPGDTLSVLLGQEEGEAGPCFCAGEGPVFSLYLEMARNTALENGAKFRFLLGSRLPEAHTAAVWAFAKEKDVPCDLIQQ